MNRTTHPIVVLTALFCTAGVAGAAPGKRGPWKPARGLPGGKENATVRVRAVAESAGATKLEYEMPELKAVKTKRAGKKDGAEEEISRLVLGNAPSIGNPGKPVLPVVPCYVVLPSGAAFEGVDVVCDKARELPGTYMLAHGQKSVPLVEGAKQDETPQDPAVYGSDEPWPKSAIRVIGVQKKRGVSILVVNLNPVVYRPKSGKVSVYPRMTLKVRSTSGPAIKTGSDKYKVKYRPDKVRPISLQVDNPAALATYKEAKR